MSSSRLEQQQRSPANHRTSGNAGCHHHGGRRLCPVCRLQDTHRQYHHRVQPLARQWLCAGNAAYCAALAVAAAPCRHRSSGSRQRLVPRFRSRDHWLDRPAQRAGNTRCGGGIVRRDPHGCGSYFAWQFRPLPPRRRIARASGAGHCARHVQLPDRPSLHGHRRAEDLHRPRAGHGCHDAGGAGHAQWRAAPVPQARRHH